MIKMNSKKVIEFLIRNDLKAFLLCFIILISLIPCLSFLKSDFTHKAFYNTHDQLLAIFQDYEKTFGNDDRLVIIAHFKDQVFRYKNIQIVNTLVKKLENTKSIINVEYILNVSFSFEDIRWKL